jgi:hypothetical protein
VRRHRKWLYILRKRRSADIKRHLPREGNSTCTHRVQELGQSENGLASKYTPSALCSSPHIFQKDGTDCCGCGAAVARQHRAWGCKDTHTRDRCAGGRQRSDERCRIQKPGWMIPGWTGARENEPVQDYYYYYYNVLASTYLVLLASSPSRSECTLYSAQF